MPQDLISVIVTCYNREAYIIDCLTSIQKQSYINFECIVVDDGSTDKSRELIQLIVDSDPRFKLIPIDHVGFPEAKNVGLANVHGTYITFLDSDDIAHPDWLHLLHLSCRISGAPIAVCKYDAFFPGQTPKDAPREELSKALHMAEYSFLRMNFLYNRDCMCFMWNKLIRADLYKDIHFEDQPALSDVAVMPYIFDKADRVIQIKVPLVHYRQHQTNMGRVARAQGDDYYVWRLGFQKRVLRFVFERHPETRFVIQTLMRQEIKLCQDALKDRFTTLVSIDDVQDILTASTIHIIEQ